MHRSLLAALLCAAAVTSPATAQTTRAISASDKAQGARANPELVAQFGGAYRGPQAAYVERVGRRVAVQSGLSNAGSDFTVTLLDSPVENAFAIPGGYVYVTRQLLALMNSEAELASVLGHEVGHVAARHSTGRQRTSTIGGVLAGIVGAVAGNSTLGQLAGAGARTGAQLFTLKYGRDQEYQADGLGVRYITAAGYDPYAASYMLAALDEETRLQSRVAGRDANAVPGWASTHPNGADRVARARKLAEATGRQPSDVGQDTAFLRMLDGLPYDDDPKEGVIDGSTFRHPGLRLRFTAPAGYAIANGSDAVTVSGSGGSAQFRSAGRTDDLAGFVQAQLRKLGAAGSGQTRSGTIGGMRYAADTVRAAANGRAVDATVIALAGPTATDWFLLVTPAGSGVGPFASLLDSVAPLTAAEAGAIKGKRIRIVEVKPGDTVASLSRQMAYPDYREERFATLNGLDAGETPRPGTLVKLVVTG